MKIPCEYPTCVEGDRVCHHQFHCNHERQERPVDPDHSNDPSTCIIILVGLCIIAMLAIIIASVF